MNVFKAISSALSVAVVLISLVLTGCVTTTSDSAPGPGSSSTIPKNFHGTWTYHSSGIHPGGGEEPWSITARSTSGHESHGSVSSVTIHESNSITVIEEVSAEGMEYTEETRFTISADGSTLEVKRSEGGPFTLYRVR